MWGRSYSRETVLNGLDASRAPNDAFRLVKKRRPSPTPHSAYFNWANFQQHATPPARIRVMPRARVSPEKRKRTARACDPCKRSKLKVPSLILRPIVFLSFRHSCRILATVFPPELGALTRNGALERDPACYAHFTRSSLGTLSTKESPWGGSCLSAS